MATARAFVRASGIGLSPVRWPSRSGRSGPGEKPVPDGSRDSPLAHVLVGVVAERGVWTHGGRHRDVVPVSDTELESGMYVAGPRNIRLQQPTAPERGPGAGERGARGSRHRVMRLSHRGARGDVTLETGS
ncbi:hypothetical protein ACWCP8_40290 [Streptomyces sp. NPDC002206]